MRVLWLSPCRPIISNCGELQQRKGTGGWIDSMLGALRIYAPNLEIVVLVPGLEHQDFLLNGVRYITYGVKTPAPGANLPDAICKRINLVIKETKPDIVHLQGTEHFYARCPIETFNGVPVVVSLQGLISELHIHMSGGLTIPETWRNHINLRFFLKGATIFGDQNYWRTRRMPNEIWTLTHHSHFIGRTDFDESVLHCYNPKAHYYKVNEVLRPCFYLADTSRNKIRSHSIFCGGAASYPLKGFHWLVMAVGFLKEQYPDITVRVAAAEGLMPNGILARVKTNAYWSYLRGLIKHLNVENHIVLLPSLDGDGVAEELSKAEVFVLPSLCENSSNSVGEAMIMKTPVVACYTGGMPSIIQNEEEGLLVPPYDPYQLASAISKCFNFPEKVLCRSSKARATAIERHDCASNANALFGVYSEILSR